MTAGQASRRANLDHYWVFIRGVIINETAIGITRDLVSDPAAQLLRIKVDNVRL